MNGHVSMAAAFLLALSLMARAPAALPADGTRPAELAALTKQLEDSAEAFWLGKPLDKGLRRKLKAVKYDRKSLSALISTLNGRRKPVVHLHVVNHLLEPLLSSRRDVITRMVPAVKALHGRFRRYRPLPPSVTQAPKEDSRFPPFRASMSDEALLRQVIAAERRGRIGRSGADEILKYNAQVHTLEKLVFKVMVLGGDSKTDPQLLSMFAYTEKVGLWTYADIIDALGASAKGMDGDRAKWFYRRLRTMGESAAMVKKKYVNMTQVRGHGGKTQFAMVDGYPGIELLTAANKFAAVTGQPKVKVPDKKEVDGPGKKAAEKEKKAKAKAKRKKPRGQ